MSQKESIESVFEFLLAGLLTLVSLIAVIWSTYPDPTEKLYREQLKPLTTANWAGPVALTLVTAVSYALGVTMEFMARGAYDWRLNQIKTVRLNKFASEWRDILQNCNPEIPKKVLVNLLSSHGLMRFAVTYHSEALSGEIDGQIKRLRMIRVLSLVELAMAYCGVIVTLRSPSSPLLMGDAFLLIAFLFTVSAIQSRLSRYCRSIERAFLLIALAGLKKHSI